MRRICIAALACTALGAAALAHGGATGIVKERMDGMVVLAQTMKSLNAMLSGDQTYDAKAVAASAETLKSHAGENLTKLFPEGTNPMVSEASEAIWADWDGFAAIANDLTEAAEKLGETTTLAESKAAFDTVSETCSACHKKYRIKK